jgi:Chitinase
VASPAGPHNFTKLNLAAMDRYLDFWNMMAYDYAGSWDRIAGHQANLYHCRQHDSCTPFNTEQAVGYYISRGVPPSKIVLGMPLYGRAFENTDGPGTPYSGIGEGTWENGVYDYKKLPLEGSEVRYDESAGATYCYDPVRRKMVTYDTVDMARRKAEYIINRGLGGAMWWESSADKPGCESIIGNVVEVLGGPTRLEWRENCITYPHTKYDNLRNGFPNQ